MDFKRLCQDVYENSKETIVWYESKLKKARDKYILDDEFSLSNVFEEEANAEDFCRARLFELRDKGVPQSAAQQAVQEAVHSRYNWLDSFAAHVPGTSSHESRPEASVHASSPLEAPPRPTSPTSSQFPSLFPSSHEGFEPQHTSRRSSLSSRFSNASNVLDPGHEPQSNLTRLLFSAWTTLCVSAAGLYDSLQTLFNSLPIQIFIRVYRYLLCSRWLWWIAIASVLVSFSCYLILYLLQGVPVSGAIGNKSIGSWLFKTASSPSSLILDMPITNLSAGIQSTIDSAARLSQLGITLLPITLMVEYSSNSLITASVPIRRSDVYFKEELIDGYSVLQSSTSDLSVILEDLDDATNTAIVFLSAYLKGIREDIIRLENEAYSRLQAPAITFELSSVFTVSCLGKRLLGLLSQRDILPCVSSSIALTQSYCLVTHEPWTVCRPSRLFWSYIAPPDIHEREYIIGPIINFLYHAIKKQEVLYEKTLKGIAASSRVQNDYGVVRSILNKNEHPVITELAEIDWTLVLRNQTPWYKRIFQTSGPEDGYDSILLQEQVRNLKKIHNAHRDAKAAFTEAASILKDMRRHLVRFENSARGLLIESDTWKWRALIDGAVNELPKLLEKLTNVRDLHRATKQQRVSAEWHDNFHKCVDHTGGEWRKCVGLDS